MKSIGELVRQTENEYVRGTTQISKYVIHSMHDNLEKIDAYLNSKHISGEKDSLGREKPFFNIVTAAVNIWYRATDIDRKHILVKATKTKDWLDSFLATVHLRDWMRRARFGQFLNEWGRVLSRYGSAVVKFVEKDGELSISVIPWNRLMVDPVDFESNPKIEIIELTEAQLKERVNTHGYDKEQVDALCSALKTRETLDGNRKDNKSNYIKLYEIHGVLPLSNITKKEEDEDTHVQQMHVLSFVGIRQGRKTEYQDFSLFSGKEAKDPYMITHLIKEDGRTQAIGAVENLFQAQWMMNHSMKAIKDSLDLASKLVFQTSDLTFAGRNVLTEIETGDILFHALNQPLTPLNNQAHDIVSWQSYATSWKQLGNEINGVSEAMLGAQPKSGTAWRQTEALLQESYSLFELMTENKALHLEDMLRDRILPHLKKRMDTSEEISSTLAQYEINQIDSLYIKNKAIKKSNKDMIDRIFNNEEVTPELQSMNIEQNKASIQDSLGMLGDKRFFKPSDLNDKTWKKQFKDLEWEVEIDITGEAFNTQQALTTLNTALQLIATPGFDQNKKAQVVVGRILELTGAMSPIEYNALPPSMPMNTGSAPPLVSMGGGLPEQKIR